MPGSTKVSGLIECIFDAGRKRHKVKTANALPSNTKKAKTTHSYCFKCNAMTKDIDISHKSNTRDSKCCDCKKDRRVFTSSP